MGLPQDGYLADWYDVKEDHGWGDWLGRLTNDFFVLRRLPAPSYILYGWLNVRGGANIAGAIKSNVIGFERIQDARQHYRGTYYILIEQNSVKGYLIHGEFLCRTFAKW